MKNIRLFSALLLLMLSTSAFAQKENAIVGTSYAPLTLENINDALVMLKTDIYNVRLPGTLKNKFKLLVFMDEYDTSMVLKNHDIIWSDVVGKGTSGYNGILSIILNKKSDSTVFVSTKVGGNQGINVIKLPTKYRAPYNCNIFKSQVLIPGKKTPILLYGAGWHDASLPPGAVRFCMERELAADFTSESFKEMPHYYIFSVELVRLN